MESYDNADLRSKNLLNDNKNKISEYDSKIIYLKIKKLNQKLTKLKNLLK